MKRIFIYILFIFAVYSATAQVDPNYTMYMFNRQILNPAVAGSMGGTNVTVGGRLQWVGIEGHPETYFASVNTPVDALHGGIGGYIVNDQVGTINTFGAKLAYSFKLNIGESGSALHFGVDGGIYNKSLAEPDGGWKTSLPDNAADPILSSGNNSGIVPDLGAGVYFYMPDEKFYIGFTAQHLLESKLPFAEESKLNRHYSLMAGYKFDLSEQVKLMPNIYVKTTGSTPTIDLNMNLRIKPLTFGVSYRQAGETSDAVSGVLGFDISQRLFAAYSYDYTLSGLSSFTSGSHEIILSYTFPSLTKFLPPEVGVRDKKPVR